MEHGAIKILLNRTQSANIAEYLFWARREIENFTLIIGFILESWHQGIEHKQTHSQQGTI